MVVRQHGILSTIPIKLIKLSFRNYVFRKSNFSLEILPSLKGKIGHQKFFSTLRRRATKNDSFRVCLRLCRFNFLANYSLERKKWGEQLFWLAEHKLTHLQSTVELITCIHFAVTKFLSKS